MVQGTPIAYEHNVKGTRLFESSIQLEVVCPKDQFRVRMYDERRFGGWVPKGHRRMDLIRGVFVRTGWSRFNTRAWNNPVLHIQRVSRFYLPFHRSIGTLNPQVYLETILLIIRDLQIMQGIKKVTQPWGEIFFAHGILILFYNLETQILSLFLVTLLLVVRFIGLFLL